MEFSEISDFSRNTFEGNSSETELITAVYLTTLQVPQAVGLYS